MAPSHSRQLLIWTIPTIAVILSYFWYRRKKNPSKSDTGETTTTVASSQPSTPVKQPLQEPLKASTPTSSPNKSFSRSLSGVDSAPIDIVIPPKLKAVKSNPVVISDEDLDLEIEKIKSMRYGGSIDMRKSNNFGEEEKKNLVTVSPQKVSVIMAQQTLVEEKKRAVVEEEKVGEIEGAANGQRQNAGERDSANHSPADVMLASPSLSSISDNHSEGSNDSGKGGSDLVTPPPSRSLGADNTSVVTVYEFIIPQHLVGKLIGKHGSSVANIKDKTGAHVLVKKHPTNNKLKVCCVEGNQNEIDSALKLIRDKFPLKRFPDVTLEQVSFLPPVSAVSLIPDHLYLKLIEGINNDTIVSCIVAPNHLFLQQPTHPSFPNLNILNGYMNACYFEADSPMLPTTVPENTICVALSGDRWYRAMILSLDETNNTSYVKFLDYGGYAYIENSNLRQIRGDFMLLPFQAAECILANIEPVDESGWSDEAYARVAEMTNGAIIYTQIVDYNEDGIPLVYCYLILGPRQVVFLNQELVNQGHAAWLSSGEEAAGVTVS